MNIGLAFSAFFALLFGGKLPADLVDKLGLQVKTPPPPPKPPEPPKPGAEHGALVLLASLQNEGRLVDFLMEDIAPYGDDQIGAAVREVHAKCREVINRHFAPQPVIDAVEGSQVSAPAEKGIARFVGNVPASGKAKGGSLRHRGWRASSVSFPKPDLNQDLTILAPAEIEVE